MNDYEYSISLVGSITTRLQRPPTFLPQPTKGAQMKYGWEANSQEKKSYSKTMIDSW